MIKGGYILQPRTIDESEISNCPPHVREIWYYFLRKANHKNNPNKKLQKGQLLTSYNQILSDLSWMVGYRIERYKKHHCETAMKLLTKLQMITTTKTTRGMIVTITKYEYYQNPKNYETDSENYNKTTRKPQSTDTIDKNVKNVKNVNNILLSDLKKSDFENPLYFEITISFWELFKNNLKQFNVSTKKIEKAKGSWINHTRLLIEQDEYMLEDLRDVFRFLEVDNFWKQNIRSTSKLREKFEQLLLKARANGENKPINKKEGCTPEELAEVVSKHFAVDSQG